MPKVDLKDWIGEIHLCGLSEFRAGFKEDGSDSAEVVFEQAQKVYAHMLPRYLFSKKPFRITGKKSEVIE